jgi:ribosomal protein S18 acetylase RimI-like enzyme
MPERTDPLHLLAAAAWPAREQQEVEGWLLRASAGVTLRANSALPLVDTPAPLDDLLGVVEDFYDARLLPPRVQVADPDLDAGLAARGWEASPPVDLLVGPLPDDPGPAEVGPLDDAWLDAWWSVDGRGGEAELEVARAMLEQVRAPVAYARVVRDGAVVGVARGVAQDAWLGVFAVAVRPEARRQGLARALLGALWRWGEQEGTTTAYLQVRRDNPARALYAGMRPAGSYRYRTRPTGRTTVPA